MTTPQGIEPEHTLLTAVARLDDLRTRESSSPASAATSRPSTRPRRWNCSP
ncbi:hypothetical protein ACRAWF_02930 [Streptomyces sp. L7]